MELFYSNNIDGELVKLGPEESQHCIKVLRHRNGDRINVIDGAGTMMGCTLVSDSPKGAVASIDEVFEDWGSHPYRLNMAVCPTKNNERFEWFVEKATELGVDTISPVIGEHSERKVYKTERARKILVSAAKQSLKAAVPELCEPVSVKAFIKALSTDCCSSCRLKLIAYCFEEESAPRVSIRSALERFQGEDIVVLIGPEGDFSKEEAALAIESGFIPVHLGESRLRTETAALTAVEAVYLKYM